MCRQCYQTPDRRKPVVDGILHGWLCAKPVFETGFFSKTKEEHGVSKKTLKLNKTKAQAFFKTDFPNKIRDL